MTEAQLYTMAVGTIKKDPGNTAFSVESKADYDAASQSFKTAVDTLDATVNQWLQAHIDSSGKDANFGDALDPATQSFVDTVRTQIGKIRERVNEIVVETDKLVATVMANEDTATSTLGTN